MELSEPAVRRSRRRRVAVSVAAAVGALGIAVALLLSVDGDPQSVEIVPADAREPAVVVPVGNEVRTLVDGRLAEKWDAGSEVIVAYRLSDGRYVAHALCASLCRDGDEERIVVRGGDGRVTQIRIPGISLYFLRDVGASDGHAYALVEGGATGVTNPEQLRLYRYDIDSGGITNLGPSCCDSSMLSSASYARGVLAETVVHLDGATDDMLIERVGAGGAALTTCTPGAIGGMPTFPLAVSLSPDASRVATVVGVVDAPGLWLEWCDIATGAHDLVELGRVIPPVRMGLDFDGRYALASGMLRLPAMLVDTDTKYTTAVDAKHTERGQHFTSLADPTTIPGAG